MSVMDFKNVAFIRDPSTLFLFVVVLPRIMLILNRES
jgi:hypothetical protein